MNSNFIINRKEHAAVQNRQSKHLFPDNPQPVTYRFPHNRPAEQSPEQDSAPDQSAQETSKSESTKERHERKSRRRIFTWWNLFAVIGIITVVIQTIRYIVVPFLVMLNSLTGGAL